jgi:hypothetical protein
MVEEQTAQAPPARKTVIAAAFASAALATGLITCHWFQFDSLAALTLVPPWTWAVPALVLTGITLRKIPGRALLAVTAIWVVFFACFAEEPRSLLRFSQQLNSSPNRQAIRVISLNCNGGSLAAAQEVLAFSPDVILLQETPNKQALAVVAQELASDQSDFLLGSDASIIVRGRLRQIHNAKASHFLHAVAALDNGREIDVVSLRLSSPVFRLDFWQFGFWADHKNKRLHHRQQIQEVIDYLNDHHVTNTWIVGGDFNLVGGDGALSPFRNQLKDSFFFAGAGWGNTGTSEYPIFRVDQIWSTNDLAPIFSKAFATKNSDHRMVLADFD